MGFQDALYIQGRPYGSWEAVESGLTISGCPKIARWALGCSSFSHSTHRRVSHPRRWPPGMKRRGRRRGPR